MLGVISLSLSLSFPLSLALLLLCVRWWLCEGGSVGLWILAQMFRLRDEGGARGARILTGEKQAEGIGLRSEAIGLYTPDLRRVLSARSAQTTYDLLARTIYGPLPLFSSSSLLLPRATIPQPLWCVCVRAFGHDKKGARRGGGSETESGAGQAADTVTARRSMAGPPPRHSCPWRPLM